MDTILRISFIIAVCCSTVISYDIYRPWQEWSSCSLCKPGGCGKGNRWRYRDCPVWFAYRCESTFQVENCEIKCKVDGQWSGWKPWGYCSVTCGGGSQSRSRTCTDPAPANGGKDCAGNKTETRQCGTNECPVDGEWSQWSSCSVTCGGGTQTRTRTIKTCSNPAPANGGKDCVRNITETRECATDACPVDGKWSAWKPWGDCSVTCGGGNQSRSRTCTDPAPANGGRDCIGNKTETRQCGTNGCPVDGKWSAWKPWGDCSVTCGGGNQSRSRTCTNPAPANGGKDCVGNKTETRQCGTNGCPVDGKWSTWKPWGDCSVTCGGGNQSRSRTCTDPAPANGGKDCVGNKTETRQCGTNRCPVDGKWSAWKPWGDCSVTCGGGTQSRSRTCTNPAPANGGKDCVGNKTETRVCRTNACQVCKVGDVIYDKCGQRCVCSSSQELTQCTRIRKEFTTMTTAERQRYVETIKTASTNSKYKSRYDALITIHKEIFDGFGIHEREHFLTWHRWFLLQYENLLREVNCNFTVAYWDWSIVSGMPWETDADDVWYSGDSGLGGDGVAPFGCVNTGPFRQGQWQLVPSASSPRCLQRAFDRIPPDSVAVALVLDIPPNNFVGFELAVRVNLHNSVHCMISGTMCSDDSASAPEFFFHHGFIDKIWEDWQNKTSAHRNAFFLGLNSPLPRANGLLPRDFIHNNALPGGVRVEYEPVRQPVVANVVARVRSMSPPVLRRIPREGFSFIGKDAVKMFHVSNKELAEAKKINAYLQPMVRSRPSKQAAKMDKKLGYDHKIIMRRNDYVYR